MKKILKFALLVFTLVLLMQCSEDDEIVPIDEPEVIEPISTNPDQSFAIQGEKSNITDDGYDVSGNLLVQSDSADIVVISDANFTVSLDATGEVETIEGSGMFEMPDIGFFKKLAFDKAVEVAFVYNTGKFFKDGSDKFTPLPLRDESYYFYYNLLNVANGEDETLSIKNAELGVTSYFLNVPQEEIIIPTGTFGINTPEGKISIGNNLAIGLSVKKSFPFTPRVYEDSALNAIITNQAAFNDMSGAIYLAGEMSLGKQIPMKLNGDVVMDGDIDELFTNGFDASTSFSLAMNGNLVFGHDLLDLIPRDFDVELASATIKFDQTTGGSGGQTRLKFAGDFDDNVWMETVLDAIAGTNVSQYVPFTGNEGNMYFSLGENWEFYVNTYFAINTPNMGKQNAREGTLHVTSDKLEVNGKLAIPYMTAEVAASGSFEYNGKFLLAAKAKGDIEFQNIKMKSNLDITITNENATLKGNVTFPGGLAEIDVEGMIDEEGMDFKGEAANRSVKFGQIESPMADIMVNVNLRKSYPYLKIYGKLELPQLEKPLVQLSGKIDPNGLDLGGYINSALKPSGVVPKIPLVNIAIRARSTQGINFSGEAIIPYGLAKATATGSLTTRKDLYGLPEFALDLTFASDPEFKIAGTTIGTSDLKMSVSTVEGVKFEGKIELDHFGWMNCKGEIGPNAIGIESYFGNRPLEIGSGIILQTGLTLKIGSNFYPYLATADGWVKTTFGQMDVTGGIGINGNISLNGKISGCGNIPLVPYSGEYVNTFNFSGASGVSVSATGSLCKNDCDEKKDCKAVEVSAELDWANSSLKVCFPVPLFGNRCLSL